MSTKPLVHAPSGRIVAYRVHIADRWVSRLVGLLGQSSLPDGEALFIRPCRSIHTFGMRFAIDVVFVDRHGSVVSVHHAIGPSRICSGGKQAFAALELPAGRADAVGITVGDPLRWSRSVVEQGDAGSEDGYDSWANSWGGESLLACVISDRDVYPQRTERDEGPLPHDNCDLLIALGDLSDETILAWWERLGRPEVVAVRGNHDVGTPLPPPVRDMHGQSERIQGIQVAGLSGCLRYREGPPHMWSDEEASAIVAALGAADLLISHNSPSGIHERGDSAHIGFSGLREMVDQGRAGVLLHGHQHSNRESRFGSTWVLRIYGHRFLRIPIPVR